MRSNDIEVYVPDQGTKDATLNMEQPEGIKILRQDYPVEVPGVPLTLRIAGGKDADNTALIRSITADSARILPGVAINRIRWINPL